MSFGWLNRLNRAKKQNAQLKKDVAIATQVFQIEGENKIMQSQFGIMDRVQTVLVENEIKGLNDGLKKSLPQIAQARRESGAKQMTGYINSVRTRALPPSK